MARSGKTVRVDANEGWDLETAVEKTLELYRRKVELCEQPLPHADEEESTPVEAPVCPLR
jgi:L-alanine-DL-glutamate epimerase-like enolase superfamily enzyme